MILPTPPIVQPEGTMGFSPGFIGAFADGSFVSYSQGALEIPPDPGPAWFRHLILNVAPAAERFDTIGDFRFALYQHWDGREETSMLVPHSVHELTYGDELIRANTESYEYQVVRRDGTVRLVVRKSPVPEPVTAQHRESMVRNTMAMFESSGRATPEQLAAARQRLESAPAPATMPLFSSVISDSAGNVWVERYRWADPWSLPVDPQPTTWDVFSPDGDWITEIVVPAGVVLRSVSSDRAYAVLIDETQVKHVFVYRIEKGGS
jgi:hypothetical protein